jgi:hypothetical protein
VKTIGGYATVNGDRLYHHTSSCTPHHSASCPKATFTLAPNHAGGHADFEVKYCKDGRCYRDTNTYRLDRRSKSTIYFTFRDSRVIGRTMAYRLIFKGDADHLGSSSAYAKAKMTA